VQTPDPVQTPGPIATPTPTPAPTPAPDPTDTTEPTPISGQGYQLVKNWDFVSGIRDLNALAAEFHPVYSGGWRKFNEEWQRFQDFNSNNHQFTSEGLALRAYLPAGLSLANGNIHSGMLRSKSTVRYGYIEAIVKVPNVPGAWPAFWLYPEDNNGAAEIDIMEIVRNPQRGEHTARSYHVLHPAPGETCGHPPATYKAPSTTEQWRNYTPGFDFAAGFHKFAVIWEPGRVRHYVDDVLVYDTPYYWPRTKDATGCPLAAPAPVLINYAMGGGWPGDPVAASLPSSYVVKRVQVWQKP
jgi:beta-glucanase (GH16 family)